MEEQPPPVQPSQKHSGIGITSFVISIVAAIAIFVVFVIAGILEASTPGGLDEKSAAAIITGLGIIALILVDIVALGLGIAGLFQRERIKLFAILGAVFSFATVGCTIVLIVLGLIAKQT